MHWFVGAVCWLAVALTLAFALCRLLGLWSQATSWLKCSKEEKANLTKSGIYDVNGFLIKSDVDDYDVENYHRFDVDEAEYPMATIAIFPMDRQDVAIPPQPLRPAPIIVPKETNRTSIVVDDDNNGRPHDKVESYYHYNISTAATHSFISPKHNGNNVNVDDDNDIDTINNLNIFKKPEYTSTNPFAVSDDLVVVGDAAPATTAAAGAATGKKSFEEYDGEETTNVVGNAGTVQVRRAISCDSVSSDTSLGPLESPLPTVTGQLCLSLRCYRINSNDSLLAVNVIEARNLQGDSPDTYVEIFLLPEHKGGHFKTKTCRETNCPSYNETFLVDLGKTNKKLCFHIYNTKNEACSLIGEAELSLQDAGSYKQPVTTWLTLTDTGKGVVEYGELMLSLSYLPTAERLTLIITRARRLPDPTEYNVFFKVYLQKNGKKVAKKRTSIKRSETIPTFNEAFIFSVPPSLMSSIEIRITLVYFPTGVEYQNLGEHQKVGHVVLYHGAPGKPGNHWNQMINSLRRPVSMWHTLRRPHA